MVILHVYFRPVLLVNTIVDVEPCYYMFQVDAEPTVLEQAIRYCQLLIAQKSPQVEKQ